MNAAVQTKTHVCDIQSFAPNPYGDEAHARFDRLLTTLGVSR